MSRRTTSHPAGLAGLLAAALVVLAGWLLVGSRLPDTYSAMDMGYADHGTGAAGGRGAGEHAAHALGPSGVEAVAATGHGSTVSVTELLGDRDRPADVSFTLTAARAVTTLADGRPFDGYTVNGGTPGPTLAVAQGQLVEVRFRNENVTEGATLHWHGLDVPNGEDGVAGVTQDAVRAGGEHVYRFVAEQAGTFWYHSHQVSHRQVVKGLLGALVVTPRAPVAGAGGSAGSAAATDVVALVHAYDGRRTINGRAAEARHVLQPGSLARVRVINTDNGPAPVWVSGTAYRVLAIDGEDLSGPTEVSGHSVALTAGGRVDLEVRVPAAGARVELPGASLVLGPAGAAPPASPAPRAELDLLTYGTAGPLGFDPSAPDRVFDYDIGRRFGFLDGRPGLWWTINGHLYPDVPMFMVREDDVVVMRIRNDSGDVHPMHLHGHHVTVLERDGRPSTGSPWRVDSLNVRDGETWTVAFVADNPGVWMDHCHNLPHAREGLMTHLMYEGVTTPFLLGRGSGNEPE